VPYQSSASGSASVDSVPVLSASPDRATFDAGLGLFVLREADLNLLEDPEAAVLDVLESTYKAGADLAGWDRAGLEAVHRPGERAEALPWPPRQPAQPREPR
jgi:uncharacterized protein DUF5996